MNDILCMICGKSKSGPFVRLEYSSGYSQKTCMSCLKGILKEEEGD